MLTNMFGEPATGRLGRLAFVGSMFLLLLIVTLISAAIVTSIGVAGAFYAGEFFATQAAVHAAVGLPAFLALVFLLMIVTFAHFNIVAKRIRDIGLPGWTAAIGWVVVMWFLRRSVSEGVAETLSLIAVLVLIFFPGRGAPREPAQR